MPISIEPHEVPAYIPQDSRVFIQGGSGEPSTIIQALADSPKTHRRVSYTSVSIPGVNNFSPHNFHSGASFETFFIHAGIDPQNVEALHFAPMHYRDIARFLSRHQTFDACIFQVSPPDRDGRCSLGISLDFVPTVLDNSRLLIAEINPNMPAVRSSQFIPYERIDLCVNVNHALPELLPPNSFNETEEAIGRNVASLIDDGSCIQIGIGKLPAAILRSLNRHRDLGLHSGLISPSCMSLIEDGVMNGSRKTIDRGQHTCGIALGDAAFYRSLVDQPNISYRPVDYTHDQQTLSAIDRFVAINSALEVDLSGQANAERANGRQVSASGGLVDFVRGARASRGGKAIIAMPASAMQGKSSRIVPSLASHSVTSLCRTDIDYVVTEHGSAKLFGADELSRARALIDVAPPSARDQLWLDWEASCQNRQKSAPGR